jgi:DNA-binding beta-propeller fold protein YncE
MAVDPDRHMLYAVHLGGDMTIVDTATSRVIDRLPLTGVGLSGVATARGLAYAVNTATHQLAVVEPRSRGVIRYMLSDEPAAVAASEESGSVYVLGSRNQAIIRIDPTDGSEVGRVLLSGRPGHSGLTPADVLGLRPRLVINQSDETAFATMPEAGSLVAASNSTFPALAREIPRYDINADTLSSDQEAL